MQGARVIANWQPSALDSLTIQVEMIAMLASKGFIALGIPEVCRPERSGSQNWHQDNDGQSALLAVWSNIKPTQVRTKDKSVQCLIAHDGDVILIQNNEAFHRAPPGVSKTDDRWFARTWIKTTETPNE